MSLFTRRLHALLRPSIAYGRCLRCRRGWHIAESHDTEYQSWTAETQMSRACFPLCRECWAELTPDERLPYYRELILERWSLHGSVEAWPVVEAAVRAGK